MTPLEPNQIIEIADKAFEEFHGNSNELKGAIGALVLVRLLGWKPLLLMQDKRTIDKYETILGVSFRDIAPEVGPKAEKSYAWRAMKKVSNFWKAVKGEIANVRTPEIG